MQPDCEMGVVKSIERLEDETGRIVLRAVVDFYDGNSPDLTFKTVWDKTPVKILECRAALARKEGS